MRYQEPEEDIVPASSDEGLYRDRGQRSKRQKYINSIEF